MWKNIFRGKCHEKFGHFGAKILPFSGKYRKIQEFCYFLGKYHVKLRYFKNFSYLCFRAKMSCPQSWPSSYVFVHIRFDACWNLPQSLAKNCLNAPKKYLLSSCLCQALDWTEHWTARTTLQGPFYPTTGSSPRKTGQNGRGTVLKTKTIGEVNEKQDTTLLCAGSRCVFNWRYRVRFNERFHNWHLSVEQLGCTERRCAVRHLDWLQAVAQCRAQQLCVVSRFPLQMTQQHRSTLLATFITTILNRAADIIND